MIACAQSVLEHLQRAPRVSDLPCICRQRLPAWGFRNEVVRAIESHQVVIVAGETGCGKTTQARAWHGVRDMRGRGT